MPIEMLAVRQPSPLAIRVQADPDRLLMTVQKHQP